MRIAVLIEKYCDLNPSLGITSGHSNVMGSLRSAMIDHTVYHYDEYVIQHNKPIDDFLLSEIKDYDLLFVSYHPTENNKNVKLETFEKIKLMGIPVVLIWFDYGHVHIKNLALQISPYTSLNVIVDVFEQPNYKFLPLWVPQDESIFCYSDDKNLEVCFVGTTTYDDRRHFIAYLKHKVDLYVSGGQRQHNLKIEEYADILRRSKISLNFPSKPDGTIQAKSRIYETMLCGTLLMERKNNAITKWFSNEYVSFENEGDLLDKIKYYSRNDKERKEIADRGYNTMKGKYSAINWWNRIFEAI